MQEESKSFLDIVMALAPLIVALIAVFAVNYQKKTEYKYSIKAYDRQLIIRRLNDLYGPLQLLRRISDELHQIFKNGENFKTLSVLIEGRRFEGNDKVVLQEIIKIGDSCVDIIKNNSGLIDDATLRDQYLPKLLTHYFLMKNAFDGNLNGEVCRFEEFTFPSEIDQLLDKRVNELNAEMKKLTNVNRKSL